MSLNKYFLTFTSSFQRLIRFTKQPLKKIIGVKKIFIKILGN